MHTHPSNEYRAGYEAAKREFAFGVPCSICGKPVIISNKSEIFAQARRKVMDLKIIHKKCPALIVDVTNSKP